MLSDSPSATSSAFSLPVLAVPRGSLLRLSMQSSSVLYLNTHWFGRQIVCPGEGCPACYSSDARSRGFALCLLDTPNGWRPRIVEATPGAWNRLEGFMRMEGNPPLPGLIVEASKAKRNSPLRLEPVSSGGELSREFSSSRRLIAALAVLFKLPVPKSEQSREEWVERVRPTALNQVELAMRSR